MIDLRARLESNDHADYLKAVRELAKLPRDQVVALLWDIAQSNSGRIRARMMNPLREFDKNLADRLAVQILGEGESPFQADALYSLWKTESSAGTSVASEMLLHNRDAITRLWCATYLGTCGSREHIAVLEKALGDTGTDEEGREVRSVAQAAIAEIKDCESGMLA